MFLVCRSSRTKERSSPHSFFFFLTLRHTPFPFAVPAAAHPRALRLWAPTPAGPPPSLPLPRGSGPPCRCLGPWAPAGRYCYTPKDRALFLGEALTPSSVRCSPQARWQGRGDPQGWELALPPQSSAPPPWNIPGVTEVRALHPFRPRPGGGL